jgi:serine/threonine-protein kinase
MIGDTIQQYRIVEKIGEGGMGVVYRAHDRRLKRSVAVKVVRSELAANAERLARLRHEALLLAALNHPNIAAIHGLEEDGEQIYLVLEFVEGDSLASRIAAGPINARDAIDIARQVARAIEEAHEKGIIHRDLKPANVKVTPDGLVKVLDFGIAKALARQTCADDLPYGDTTREWAVLGTPAYMSPEQARGGPVDAATDIWAFGCVLFEMLAGVEAFSGKTALDVSAAVLRGEPRWAALPPSTPPSLRALVRMCLQTNPRNRLRHIRDARLFLDAAALEFEDEASTAGAPSARRPRAWGPPRAAMFLVLLAGVIAIVVAVRFLRPTDSPSAVRFPTAPPGDLTTLSLGFGPSLAISPDGRTIVYALNTGTTRQLYVRRLDELDTRPIAGTKSARNPFFSPLGQWVGFYDERHRQLRKVSISGGEPVPIADTDFQGGAAWTPDDTILFASNYGLVRVTASGGTPVPVTKAGAGQHMWPTVLPGGGVVLFSSLPARGSFDDADILAVDSHGGTPRLVLKSAYHPQYAATGHLVFVQGDSVLAAPFDTKSVSVTGPAITLLKGVRISSWTGYADFAFSETGTLVYVSGGPNPTNASLVSVDRSGKVTPVVDERRAYRLPRISPDGRYIAVASVDQQVDVWTYDLARKTLNRLTDSPSWDAYPAWQPGMKGIAFSSMRDGLASIYRQDLSSGTVEKLVTTKSPAYPDSWSPDGRLLAYEEDDPETGLDLWTYSIESRQRKPFLRTPFNELSAEFSPDGRYIAYESDEAGDQPEVYIRPYPAINPRWKISVNGGTSPRWGPGGKELFYRVGTKVMALSVDTTGDVTAGPPHELFDGPYGAYDIAPDGQSFIIVKEMAPGDPPTRINFVLNWFDELKRLTSARR